MIKKDKMDEYLEAIKIGLYYYGLNGFFAMHNDVCNNSDNPWTYDMESLNDLDIKEFESLCNSYLNKRKERES